MCSYSDVCERTLCLQCANDCQQCVHWLSAKCHQDSLLQLCSLQFIAVCTWKHLCTAFVHWIIFWQWPFDIANNRRGIHTCSPQWQNECYCLEFLANRTNGRAYATVLRLSSVVCLSVTLCIVAKRCVLEQKLLLRAYRKSYVRNRLVPKWMTLTFV